MKKYIIGFAVVLCLCLIPAAAVNLLSNEDTDTEHLVLMTTKAEPWLSDAVESYNSNSQGRHIELVECDTISQLYQYTKSGVRADLYFIELNDDFSGSLSEKIWESSIDLSAYYEALDVELVNGLYSALSYEGEIRYLPFDFEIFTFAARLDEMPESMAEAESLAEQRQVSLFPGFWNADSLRYWVSPFTAAGYDDEEKRQELLDAVSAHDGQELSENVSGNTLFWIVNISNDNEFGLAAYEYTRKYNGEEYVLGLPGAETAGIYVPQYVFGILTGCDDTNAAWDFLKQLYSGEYQSKANALPACADAFNVFVDGKVESGCENSYTADILRTVVERTNTAVGMKTRPY